MKRSIIFLLFVCLSVGAWAGITTYTFTTVNWGSTVGSTVCDGTNDGWVCDKPGSEVMGGRNAADGRLYSKGVSVKTGTSGAGATSVLAFENVRRVTINFCQNSGDGRGVIYVQVGDNEPDSIIVRKPAKSGDGVWNRDSVITFATPLSGKIKFHVKCTHNAININSLSIRSSSGGSSVFTMDTYQLVTKEDDLQDLDQVIIGVAQEGCNYIMGYFDEEVSVNNIHAIPGRYSSDRSQVDADDRAIYTLHKTTLNGQTAYIFQDELRYEEAYLVASGGQTKNRLALWDRVVDEGTYGNYGYWTITIGAGGEAVITNLGNSLGKIIQYNASNKPTLFACYASQSQTPVCLYRRVEALGDIPAIVAPMVNFGTTIESSGSRTVTINANRLSEDISATLLLGEVFSLSANTIDRDGDELTISYAAPSAGTFVDTLVLRSGEVETRVAVLLKHIVPMNVREAVQQVDYTTVYMTDVVVTKKYDNYIYVRDESGSMLIFDRGDGATGKRYGADLKQGNTLIGVTGKMVNYYGVPELMPTTAWKTGKTVEVLPEQAGNSIDSADVCRYLVLDSVVVNSKVSLVYKGKEYGFENKFNLPSLIENVPTRMSCIVSYDYNNVALYIVSQERYSSPSGIETAGDTPRGRVILHEGILYIETAEGRYDLQGEKVL